MRALAALIAVALVTSNLQAQSDLSCGHWQDEYTALHRSIIAGHGPQRYLFSILPSTGLADKLVAMPSELMWAMLTNRALQYIPRHGFPPFDHVFDFPSINVTGPRLPHHIADSPNRIDFIHYVERRDRTAQNFGDMFKFSFGQYFPICLRNNDSANRAILTESNLRLYPPSYYNTRALLVESNRGMSYRIFDNPFHRGELQSWGLTRENAFACAMKFLFHPKDSSCDDTCRSLGKRFDEAHSNNIVVIGIHVRIGDASMGGEDVTTLDKARAHFKCATDISEHLMGQQRESIFFLMSDSINLLKLAKGFYGGRLLVDTTTKPSHTAHCLHCNRTQDRIRQMQHAINQVYLFSRCDYHIVTTNSGFGMMGAWMNGRPVQDRVFQVSGDSNPVCNRQHGYRDVVTDPRALASSWSGI